MSIRHALCAILFSTLCGLSVAAEQPSFPTLHQSHYFLTVDNNGNSFFGTSVAIAGDTVVVGAENQGSDRQGAAFVFTKSGNSWTQVAQLTASDNMAGEEVGFSLAISSDGNTIFVGAPVLAVNGFPPGSVYVFVKPAGGWMKKMTETAKLTATNSGYLGTSLALSGDGTTLVVGSEGQSGYVFVKPQGGWVSTNTPSATLADTTNPAVRYASISPDGSTIADGVVDSKTQNGVALVYLRPGSQWHGAVNPTAKLAPSTLTSPPGFGDEFGAGIATDGNIVAIGAVQQNNLMGDAYIYVKPVGGWKNMTETATISPPTAGLGQPSDFFGFPVLMAGKTVLVGYGGAIAIENGRQWLSGEAYGYVEPNGGWQNTDNPTFSLLPSQLINLNVDVFLFCNSMAVDASSNTVLVGAPGSWYKGQPLQGFPGLSFLFDVKK
ncbi:MAG TPA: FG-GAP repeat protein [Candidatus Dormibacteraeota bacterium]|nr:FG-GAP repeat protein [Candidatus Dormibacteraeota bacterium]